MKRSSFIKSFVSVAGGYSLVSCSSDIFVDLIDPTNDMDNSVSLDEAKIWFDDSYLPNMERSRVLKSDKDYKRKCNWAKSYKPNNKKNVDFIWIPIEYDSNDRPGLLMYDDETLYKKELSKYFFQPILEGLIIFKENGQFQAFLGQLAYDPIQLASNNYELRHEDFSGTLIFSDWNDGMTRGAVYKNGKFEMAFRNSDGAEINAKITDCYTYYFEYQTWGVDSSDGSFKIILHKRNVTLCDTSGAGSSTGGSGAYAGGWGSTLGGGGSPGTPTYDYNGYFTPYMDSGAGTIPIPVTPYFQINLDKAFTEPGIERAKVNANLAETMNAVGLAYNITSWSFSKADALSRSIGLNLSQSFPVIYGASKSIGVFQALFGVREIWGIVSDGTITPSEVGPLASAALGVAVVFTSGWVAVIVGGVSLYIAVRSY